LQPGIKNKTVALDKSGHFLTQRICPNRKIPQLGLVVSLAMLFKNHAAGPKALTGQSAEDARKVLFETGMKINLEGRRLVGINSNLDTKPK
jgi:hypothetical protein